MDSFILRDEDEVQAMRDLVHRLGQECTVQDFEELISLSTVRANTRLWTRENRLLAFALVDDFNNLWFDVDPAQSLSEIAPELVGWGVTCIRQRNAESNTHHTLDATCRAQDVERIRILRECGFALEPIRTLRYSHSLLEAIPEPPLPEGLTIRCVSDRDSIESLVSLHRASFGTENMTVEQRTAMMRNPDYVPSMDLVAVAPDGSLVAFCVCGIDATHPAVGYTDPIGTDPRFRRMGLAKATLCAGMRLLKTAGVVSVELGTSSENLPMQKLAGSLGFVCVSEKFWFSKAT